MKLIFENKQVGMLAYFVGSLDVFENILTTNKIVHSRSKELNYNTNKSNYSISFSRDFDSPHRRNPKKWRFGVIVDGDELSNKYEIIPVSYTGVVFQKSGMCVKCITAYDNNTFSLQFVNWKSFPISEKIFNSIKQEILNMSDAKKDRCGLVIQTEGKRTVNGRRISEKYLFTRKYEGLTLTSQKYPELTASISKLPAVNEFEERIWVINKKFIDIKGTVCGVILPNNMTEDEYDYFTTYIDPILNVKGIDFIYSY